MFGILVAAIALTVIGVHFWNATRPLRDGSDTPCAGCTGCARTDPSRPEKTLYQIDPLPISNESKKP